MAITQRTGTVSGLPGSADAGMQPKRGTMIVTGAAKGIGAGVTRAFIDRGYNVVANSRDFANSAFAPSEKLALVDGERGNAHAGEREMV